MRIGDVLPGAIVKLSDGTFGAVLARFGMQSGVGVDRWGEPAALPPVDEEVELVDALVRYPRIEEREGGASLRPASPSLHFRTSTLRQLSRRGSQMRSRDKLIVTLAIAFGLVVLSAGVAVGAGVTGGDESTALVSEEPNDDDSGSDEKQDDDDGSAGNDDADKSLTGEAATKASDAALAATGGGTVLAVESDDGNAGYEVEIRKDDGSEVEVELDKGFKVVQRADD